MTKFQKIEKIICLIPIFSDVFILIATIVELIKNKATPIYWVLYAIIMFFFGILNYVVGNVLMSGEIPVLIFFANWCITILMNLSFVQLQIKCYLKNKKNNE